MRWRKRGRDLFRDYELQVIDLIRSGLDERGADLLDRQIGSTESVHRMFDDQDVLLYPNRRRPQHRDPDIAFPNIAKELRLATVRLSGSKGTGKVVIHVVEGHIFELDFRPSPNRLGERSSLRATGISLHADPMTPDDGAGPRRLLAQLDDGTRAEYESLTAASPADSFLSGLAELYSIHLEDGEYLVLAQLRDTSFVVAPTGPKRSGVRRFWPDGEAIADYASIRAAIDDADVEPNHSRGG